MRYFIYQLLLVFLAPLGIAYLLFSKRYRQLLQRFRPHVPASRSFPLWIHAASVGEVRVAKGLIEAIHIKRADMPIILTVSTLSGLSLAEREISGAAVTLAPFDLIWSVRSFVRRVRPRKLVIIETELWPNLLRETRRHGAEVIILNGRVSASVFPRYKRLRYLMPPLFQYVSAVCAQETQYAERFRQLGIPDEAITVTGNMKWDTARLVVNDDDKRTLRRENGFSMDDQIIIFGSLRSGDEQLAAACWQQIKVQYPQAKIILAPRHLERLPLMQAPFADEDVTSRTDIKANGGNPDARVFFLDTFGELVQFYAIASVAVIGGSFFSGVNGHNPLEPAAVRVATIFGPEMDDFRDAAHWLLDRGGAIQVQSPEALLPALQSLLDDPIMRDKVAECGLAAVEANQGAVDRNSEFVLRSLE